MAGCLRVIRKFFFILPIYEDDSDLFNDCFDDTHELSFGNYTTIN